MKAKSNRAIGVLVVALGSICALLALLKRDLTRPPPYHVEPRASANSPPPVIFTSDDTGHPHTNSQLRAPRDSKHRETAKSTTLLSSGIDCIRLTTNILQFADTHAGRFPTSEAELLSAVNLGETNLILALKNGRTTRLNYLPGSTTTSDPSTILFLSETIDAQGGRLAVLLDGGILQLTAAELAEAAELSTISNAQLSQ